VKKTPKALPTCKRDKKIYFVSQKIQFSGEREKNAA
jgi:hypothetical protein